jgi:hypothetical protein
MTSPRRHALSLLVISFLVLLWYEISKCKISYQWVLDIFLCLLSFFIMVRIEVMKLFVECFSYILSLHELKKYHKFHWY